MAGSHAGDSGARDGDAGGVAVYAGDVIIDEAEYDDEVVDEAVDELLGDAGVGGRRGGVLYRSAARRASRSSRASMGMPNSSDV